MLKRTLYLLAAMALVTVAFAPAARAIDQGTEQEYDNYDRVRTDRYLAAEVWTDHADGEYYTGDNITISFRVNRDAFVAIYSLDSRGRVNLLFPNDPSQDNFVYGGVTNTIPGEKEDYDLVITGPEGVENIQIIASRDRIPIPDWYGASGLVCDWDDRFEFMDYINRKHFVKFDGQSFAYDRAAVYVNEWEPTYFQPVYYPDYPSWMTCGNVYIDYPFGGSVYINGVYWGCAPLYIPRIYVGWHTITIYDHWGYCWEHDVHITRYNTVVLDRREINPSGGVVSKYKEVREVGYRDPVKSGYPDYDKRKAVILGEVQSKSKDQHQTVPGGVSKKGTNDDDSFDQIASKKEHVKGTGTVVKTDRGYESEGITPESTGDISTSKSGYKTATRTGYSGAVRSKSGDASTGNTGYTGGESGRTKNTSSGGYQKTGSISTGSSSSGGYYQKKSGSSTAKGSTGYKKSTESGSIGGKSKTTGGGSVGSKVTSKSTGSSSSKGNSSVGASPKASTPSSSSGSTGGSYKTTPSTSGSGASKSSTSTSDGKSKGR